MKINFNGDQNGHKHVCADRDLGVLIEEPNYKQKDVSEDEVRIREISCRVQASKGVRS